MKFLKNLELQKTIGVNFTTDAGESKRLYWDNFDNTLSLEMQNGIVQQIGQEQYFLIKNNDIVNIPNGSLVMANGALGASGRITGALANTDGSISSEYIIGIATEDIPVGADGFVTSFGIIRDIPISKIPPGEIWESGDKLYGDPSSLGGLTKIKPSAPNLKIAIAMVLYVNETYTDIFVRAKTGEYLQDLHDVDLSNVLDGDIVQYDSSSGIWKNISNNDLQIKASNSMIDDTNEYYDSNNSEGAFQELGEFSEYMRVLAGNLGSTGITESLGLSLIDTSHFSVGATTGYIIDNTTNSDDPSIVRVDFAGQANLTTPYLDTNPQTEVFINSSGQIVLTATLESSGEDNREMIFIGRVIHPNGAIIAYENTPQVILSSVAQLRDLWRALGHINNGVYVYPNGTNLNLSLHGGSLHYQGINFVNNNLEPSALNIPSQTILSFGYRDRYGIGGADVTVIDPTKYDNNGTLTTVPTNWKYSTNQRIFLANNGTIKIQYGQTYYLNLEEAINNIHKETFEISETLKYNTILIGILSVTRDADDLSDSEFAYFTGVGKLGELVGGTGGGGGAGSAIDIAVTDGNDYYTTSNVEDVLQEIGYNLSNITSNESIVMEGSSINVSSLVEGNITTYTVSHEDTSTLSGSYGGNGISSLSVDEKGHLTAVTTDSYLKINSNDFDSFAVTDNNSGYTWSETGAIISGEVGDTLTFVSGNGINLNIDSTAKAVLVDIDTSSLIIGLDADQVDGFDASISNIASNIVVRDTDNSINVGDVKADSISVNGSGLMDSASLSLSTISQTALYSFPIAIYSSGKFIIEASKSGARQITELLVLHDGTNAFATEYGLIITDDKIFDVEVDIVSGELRVLVTNTLAVSTEYKSNFILTVI